jgi:hypothetical protein
MDAPKDLTPAQQALWWLKQGHFKMGKEWQKAHEICQQDEGNPDYDMVHALVHRIEGDESNARYWYARIKVQRLASIEAEWERGWKLLGGGVLS